MEILFFLIGLTAAAAVSSYVISKKNRLISEKTFEAEELAKKYNELLVAGSAYSEKIKLYENEKNMLSAELKFNHDSLIKNASEISALKTNNENLARKLSDQQNELEKLYDRFSTEFKNIANEILEDKSKRFTEQNKQNIGDILFPLNEKIKEFEKRVEETYDRESKQRFSLEKEIKNLFELNQKMSKDANNLTNALKGQTKTQGSWGEFILESILEKSGLVKDREYFIQISLKDEAGRSFRPDVLVRLPEKRTIVIDSKVSLTAYERFSSCDDEAERMNYLNSHCQSVKMHIKELGEKKYQNLYEINSLDYVLLFINIEPALGVALQVDGDIFNYAFERNIVIVTPSTLLAVLRTVSNIWRYENQSRNVTEIARQAGALYDKFTGMLNDLIDLGNKFNGAQRTYDDIMSKLSTGRGNLISQAEKIKQLGAKTSKTIPNSLMERNSDDFSIEE